MVGLAILVSAVLSPVAGENLLTNPSFEERTPDGRPRAWSSFVMPQPGAFADVDPLAFGGAGSVMLHNPAPYTQEPANNWSQVIIANVRGQTLEFSGYARTEAAGEAALWVQCFQQRPARVVAAQTSALNDPLTGTTEWTRLSATVTAPPSTDFVVVRCVLKGRGSAWFDELRLDVVAQTVPPIDPVEPPLDAPDLPTPEADLDAADIVQLSQALQKAVADLESTNARILERVQELRDDLERSRAQAAELDRGAPAYGPHPLVPRGYVEKGEPE